MFKHGIDQEALIKQFAEASTKQGEAVRKAVGEATLKALQGRELTLANIRQVLNTVTQATSLGAAKSALPAVDLEALLAQVVSGMDSALQQAVHANQRALQQIIEQGATIKETQVKKALADVEKMEDALFAAVRKAAEGAGEHLATPWASVLQMTQAKGTGTGTQASEAVGQLMDAAQKNLREGRALTLKAGQALLDSYATLVSGVLIGMSESLSGGASAEGSSRSRKK